MQKLPNGQTKSVKIGTQVSPIDKAPKIIGCKGIGENKAQNLTRSSKKFSQSLSTFQRSEEPKGCQSQLEMIFIVLKLCLFIRSQAISIFILSNKVLLRNKINMSEQLRQKILADEEIQARKKRFGLFSQPPPLAVGDNSAYAHHQKPRGQNGKPITSPPQLLSGTCRTGVAKSSYFGVPESVYQKDPYTQTFKREIEYQRKMHSRGPFHENQFKPASGSKVLNKPAYKYIAEKVETNKKIEKDDNGRVKTQPRNFTTNPISKVQTQFFKHNKHLPDPYDRKKQIERQEHQLWASKLQENRWKSMSHGNNYFQKQASTYGEDEKTKRLSQNKKPTRLLTTNSYAHQAKFKPAIKNSKDPIGKYPKFIQPQGSMIPKSKRIKTQGSTNQRQLWKPNTSTFSRPTPSVLLNHKNMKIGSRKLK